MSAAPKIGLKHEKSGRRSGRLEGIGERPGLTRLAGVGVASVPDRLGRVGTRFVEGLGSMRLKAGWALALLTLVAFPATASAQGNDTTIKAPVIVERERATRAASLERVDSPCRATRSADLARVNGAIRDAFVKRDDMKATSSAHCARVFGKHEDEALKNHYQEMLIARLQRGEGPLTTKIHLAKEALQEKYDQLHEERSRENGGKNEGDRAREAERHSETHSDHMQERDDARRERRLEAQLQKKDDATEAKADAAADKATDRADAKAEAKQEAQDERKKELRDERHTEQTDERHATSSTAGVPGSK